MKKCLQTEARQRNLSEIKLPTKVAEVHLGNTRVKLAKIRRLFYFQV